MENNDSPDIKLLSNYLQHHVSGFKGPISLEKFSGGQSNPTYKVSTPSGVYVLRKQPSGKLLKSAHAVDREFRVLDGLKDTNVPVPKVFHLCEDTEIAGSMFYVMEFIDGNIFWNAALSEINSNSIRSAMYDEMNKVLVALHCTDISACNLNDYGRKDAYFQRQLSRWSGQYKASEITTISAMDSLMKWLEDNLPEDDERVSIVHGDFRLDNMIFHKDKPEILAVLDWELSTLGHPFADLAYQCMQMRMPQGLGSIDGLQGIDRTSLGIPSEEEYVARYCERMGIGELQHWNFYLAFSFFRLAAIAQGVAKRAQQGNASNSQASKVGAFVEPLALMALDVIHN